MTTPPAPPPAAKSELTQRTGLLSLPTEFLLATPAGRDETQHQWVAWLAGVQHAVTAVAVRAELPGSEPDCVPGEFVADLTHRANPWVVVLTTRGTDPLPVGTADVPAGLGIPGGDEPVAEHRGGLGFPDDQVASVLALTALPPVVAPGWLTGVTALAGVTRIAVHLEPVTPARAARLLRRVRTRLAAAGEVSTRTGRLVDPTEDLAAAAAEQLARGVATGSTRLLRTQLLVAVVAPSLTELAPRRDALTAALARWGAEVRVLGYQQDPAWRATEPVAPAALGWPWLWVDTATAAACLPHPDWPHPHTGTHPGTHPGTDPGCSDPDRAGSATRAGAPPRVGTRSGGVLVGRHTRSGVPLTWDRFASPNPGRLIIGTSGSGKSVTSRLEVLRELTRGVTVTVIDPEGEYGALTTSPGAVQLCLGATPGGIDPVAVACQPGLEAGEALALVAVFHRGLTSEDLTPGELSAADRALARLRARGGGDLTAFLVALDAGPDPDARALAARLRGSLAGTLGEVFTPHPALGAGARPQLLVADLRAVPDQVRAAVTTCVLTWAWLGARPGDTAAGDLTRDPLTTNPLTGALPLPAGTGGHLLVIDEAHLLLADPAAADLLAGFTRRARKHRIGIELCTQRLADFTAHPAGQVILANTASVLLLGTSDSDRPHAQRVFALSDAETELLRPGVAGRGLWCTPAGHTPIQVVADTGEWAAASAGPRGVTR